MGGVLGRWSLGDAVEGLAQKKLYHVVEEGFSLDLECVIAFFLGGGGGGGRFNGDWMRAPDIWVRARVDAMSARAGRVHHYLCYMIARIERSCANSQISNVVQFLSSSSTAENSCASGSAPYVMTAS